MMSKWMDRLARASRVRPRWGIVGFVLLVVLIWSVSTMFRWPWRVPIIGTVLLAIVAAAVLIVRAVRAVRRATALERSIRGQARDRYDAPPARRARSGRYGDEYGARPERLEQIEEVEREFAAAVDALRQSKVGKRRRGRAALYALPWYVVIGPPAAGKTTAILESGLDFPLGTDRVRGIGGTRNCDWIVSTSAILLDTAGRYMTVEEDRDEWLAFLDLVRKHRPRTPLNGVVVMVSIDELLGATADELERAAAELRQRLSELVGRLGVRLPVYLLFTKCDLLRGFVEFFGGLTPQERKQVWGCTLPETNAGSARADARFSEELDRLVKALVDRRVVRLAGTVPDADVARESYLFPLEFAATKATLATFVGQLFQPNPYQETAEFRGFYFTSAVQVGVATDRVLRSINDRFDLAAWDTDRALPGFENTTSFLEALFTDVIIPDRHRVRPTSRAATTRRWVRHGTIAAASILLLVFGIIAGTAFAGSDRDIGTVRNVVRRTDDGTGLHSLDSLRQAVLLLRESQRAPRRFRRLGLDRGSTLLPDLQRLYVRRARPLLDARMFAAIEQRLRSYETSGDTAVDLRATAHDDLRAYLLLGSDIGRLHAEDAAEDAFLKAHLQRQLGPALADTIYTNLFVDIVDESVVRVDSGLVKQVRGILAVPPTLNGLYLGLRAEATRRFPAVTATQLLAGTSAAPLVRSAAVPGAFTKAAWERYVQSAIEERSREPGRTDWVLGAQPNSVPAELANPDEVAGALLTRYFADYAAAWRQLLVTVRYSAGDTREVMRLLDALANAERSPLATLLDSVSAETRFDNPAVSASRRVANGFIETVQRKLGLLRDVDAPGGPANPVDRAFAAVHTLRGRGDAAPLTQILGQYQVVGQSMESLGAGTPSTAAAAQLTTEVMRARIAIGQAAGPLEPSVRRAIFEQPLEIAQRLTATASVDVVGRDWRDRVCRPFASTLAEHYPFNADGSDAPLADVERFFQPERGTIWAFYDEELAGFLNAADFRPRPGQQAGVAISPAATAALAAARTIRDGMFGGDGLRVAFDLVPEPPVVEDVVAPTAPVVVENCIAIDGQRDCYRNGTPFPHTVTWPGTSNQPGAAITATIRDGKTQVILREEVAGDWGLFRLLDRAAMSAAPDNAFRFVWRLQREGRYAVRVSYRVVAKSSLNPFANRRLFSRFQCPMSLQ
jgi:type VI secretion system protein ImpL